MHVTALHLTSSMSSRHCTHWILLLQAPCSVTQSLFSHVTHRAATNGRVSLVGTNHFRFPDLHPLSSLSLLHRAFGDAISLSTVVGSYLMVFQHLFITRLVKNFYLRDANKTNWA